MKKLFLFVLFIYCFNIEAQSESLLKKIISFQYENVTLDAALTDLQTVHGISFAYSSDYIDTKRKVNAKVKNQPLYVGLNILLQGTDVVYSNIGNTIALKSFEKELSPEEQKELLGMMRKSPYHPLDNNGSLHPDHPRPEIYYTHEDFNAALNARMQYEKDSLISGLEDLLDDLDEVLDNLEEKFEDKSNDIQHEIKIQARIIKEKLEKIKIKKDCPKVPCEDKKEKEKTTTKKEETTEDKNTPQHDSEYPDKRRKRDN